MNDYYVPSEQELLDAIRAEMSFLVRMYGFQEVTNRSEKYINSYSVLYKKKGISLLVEGVSYGFGLNCYFTIETERGQRRPEHINLGYLMMLRAPHLLEPSYPEKRGQLTQLLKLGEGLRLTATDLLNGDLSHLDEIRAFVQREQEKAAKENRRKELSRIDVKSQEAFHQSDYQQVLDLLVPIESELTASGRKRLELARRRLAQ
jgi:hypothetical protein